MGKTKKLCLLLLSSLFFLCSFVQAKTPSLHPYTIVSKPVQTPKGIITVEEFFWYSCPHCYQLKPAIEKWAKSAPSDVKLIVIPAVSNIYWRKMAILYYGLEEMGRLTPALHSAIFDAQHLAHLNLYDPDVLKTFLLGHGINWTEYQKATNSFGVVTKINKSQNLVDGYGITAVPAFVINGHYLVSPETEEEDIISSLNSVIQMIRASKKKHA